MKVGGLGLLFLAASLTGQVLPLGSMTVSGGTFTLLHVTAPATVLGCSNTCTVTVASTTAGSLQVMTAMSSQAGQNWIVSVSGAGSWSCPVIDNNANGSISGCYNVNSTAGVTTLTITSTPGGQYNVRVWEYSFTGGPVSLDTSTSNGNLTPATTQAGVTLTPHGSNDVIVQWVLSGAQPTSISGPYGNFAAQNSTSGWADLENTTSGTAPNWTFGTSQTVIAGAMAFKLGATTITALPNTCVGDQNSVLSGSVSCTWSPAAPAAGSNLVCGGTTFNGGAAVSGLSISDGTTFTNSQAARDYTGGSNRWIILSYRLNIGVTAPATVTMTITGTDQFANIVCNAFTDANGTPTADGTCTAGTNSTVTSTLSCSAAIVTTGADYVIAVGAAGGAFPTWQIEQNWNTGARVKGTTTGIILQTAAGSLTPQLSVNTGQAAGMNGFALKP